METRNRDVSVIIANHNGGTRALVCLDSVLSYAQGAEVIVVDNASSDGSPEEISRRYPQVTLIRNTVDEGFGSAVNRGVEKAANAYIFILSQSAVIRPATVPGLLKTCNDWDGEAVVAPRLLNPDGTARASARGFPKYRTAFFNSRSLLTRLFPANRFSKQYLCRLKSGPAIQKVDWVSGDAMFMRKTTFERVGGFDPAYFRYCEDTDFCRRAHLAEIPRLYVATNSIMQLEAGAGQPGFSALGDHHASMWHYYKKHFRRWFVVDCAVAAGICLRAANETARELIRLARELPARLKAQARLLIRRRVVLKRSRAVASEANPKRILILRADQLGDVLLSLRAVELCRKRFPRARIHFMGRQQWSEIVVKTGLVDEYVDFPADRTRLLRILKRGGYDAFIELGQEGALPRAVLAWLARIPVRIGYHTDYTGLFYTSALRWDGRFRPEGQNTCRLLRHTLGLGISTLSAGSESAHVIDLRPAFSRSSSNVTSEYDGMVLIHPFAVSPNGLKQWPIDRFIMLANTLSREGLRVAVVGARREGHAYPWLASKLDSRVKNLIGKTTLTKLAHLLSRSRLLIANNSGVYQLAMAMRAPVLLINGPSSLTRFGPLTSNIRIAAVEGLSCAGRECSQCMRYDHACMRELTHEQVYAAVRTCLDPFSGGTVISIDAARQY